MSAPDERPLDTSDTQDTQDNAQATAARSPDFDRKMLESLVCPVTQGQLRYDAASAELVSPTARLAFPIRNGIPIMLASEARELE